MELKILFITVLFLGASAAFSLREEQEGKQADSCITIVFVFAFWLFLIFVSFDLEFSYH